MHFFRMIKYFIFLTFLVYLSSCYLHQVPPIVHPLTLHDYLLSQGYVEIPLYQTKSRDYLLIKGTLATAEPVYFLLDTGTTKTSINTQAIENITIQDHKSRATILGESGNTIQGFNVTLPKLNLGKFASYNEPVQSAPHYLEAMHLEKKPIGTIGLNFLREHLGIIDIGQHNLYLLPEKSRFMPNQIQLPAFLLQNNYQNINLITTSSGYFTAKARVNDSKNLPFLIDSGSSRTVLGLEIAHKLGLSIYAKKKPGHGSTGGDIPIFGSPQVKFAIGPVDLILPEMIVIDFKAIQVGTPLTGALGNELLQAHHAIIDIPNKQLFLK